jgi:hypothetical protein
MGARYSVSRTAVALSTTADTLTITAPAGRSLKIWAIRLYGAASASAPNEVLIARSTAGTTPVAITPTPLNSDSAAATFTAASTWTTTPTIGVTIQRVGLNANGAAVQLVYPPGQEIDIPGGGQVSFRSASGTSLASFDVIVEQV